MAAMASSISREEMEDEIAEIRASVKEYHPGNSVNYPDPIDYPDHLIIGLFGRTGCGKSSLINSLKFAAQGRLRKAKWVEVSTQDKAGGHTMFRKVADITKSIFVVDNRGLDNPNTQKALEEVEAQLDGRRGYGQKVEWSGDDALTIDVNSGHPITCVVFVFSAVHDISTDVNSLNELVDFLHKHQGRYPMAVITHVDAAERKDVDILTSVLCYSGIGDIYEVANVTQDKARLEPEYQLNLLTMLERCMTVGDETSIFKHQQRVERKAREAAIQKKMMQTKQREAAIQKEAKEEAARQRAAADTAQNYRQHPMSTSQSPVPVVGVGSVPDAGRVWGGAVDQLRQEVKNLRRDVEYRKMEMELMGKYHAMELKHEKQQRDFLAKRERELYEQERERRFQEQIKKMDEERQKEITRIIEANNASKKSEGFIAKAWDAVCSFFSK